jgi:hypothetical protein
MRYTSKTGIVEYEKEKFSSYLEVKYYVFFKKIGLPFIYEPFDVGQQFQKGDWSPDFKINFFNDISMLSEVKPNSSFFANYSKYLQYCAPVILFTDTLKEAKIIGIQKEDGFKYLCKIVNQTNIKLFDSINPFELAKPYEKPDHLTELIKSKRIRIGDNVVSYLFGNRIEGLLVNMYEDERYDVKFIQCEIETLTGKLIEISLSNVEKI